jgi:hypothetical protein
MPNRDQLEVIRASGQIEFYELDPGQGVINIGRDLENDIVIESPGVAPFHAVLIHGQKPYHLMALSQVALTILGGEPLPPNVSREVHPWDTIEIDGHTLILLEGEAAPAKLARVSPPAPAAVARPAPPEAVSLPTPAPAIKAPPPPVSIAPRRPVGSFAVRPPDQPDDMIVTELSEREWTIDVEQTAALRVTIANGGPLVADFEVSVEGLDSDWVIILPAQINLNEAGAEGSRGTVSVAITPPGQPSSRAGAHHFAVVVTSPTYAGRHAQRGATLTVNPYFEYAVGDLSPKQQTVSWRRPAGQVTLAIENKGNSSQLFRLEGTDDERACRFEFRVSGEAAALAGQAETRLAPEESARIPVWVTPLSRRLIGLRKRSYAFTVTATSLDAGQTPRMMPGQLKSAPLFGFWHLLSMIILLMAVIGFLFYPTEELKFQSIQAQQAAASEKQQPLVVEWSAAPSPAQEQEEEPVDNRVTLVYTATRFARFSPGHILNGPEEILNRINGAALNIKLERKLAKDPETKYQDFGFQGPLERPAGQVVDDAPEVLVEGRPDALDEKKDSTSVEYRLTVKNWLSFLFPKWVRRKTATAEVTIQLPVITAAVEPDSVVSGEDVHLSWTVAKADRVVVRQQDGPVIQTIDGPGPEGGMPVTPRSDRPDTVYVIEAYNQYTGPDDPALSKPVTVTLSIPPPDIVYFNPTPQVITAGVPVDFVWRVEGATEVRFIEPGEERGVRVGPNEPISVEPKQGIYRLWAVNEDKRLRKAATVEATAQLVVNPAPTTTPIPPTPAIKFFIADPGELVKGDEDQTTLKWSVEPSTCSVEISGPTLLSPIANLKAEGAINVPVDKTTLFVLTAYNQEQKDSKDTPVQVVTPTPTLTPEPPPAEITKFVISFPPEVRDLGGGKYEVPANTDVTFSWETNAAAKKVTFTDYTGASAPGSVPVGSTVRRITPESPLEKSFTLVAENEVGNPSEPKEIKVKVVDRDPPLPPFNVNGVENPGSNQNKITWQWVSDPTRADIVGFRVYRDDNLNGNYQLVPGADENGLPKGTNTFTDNINPTCGRSYYVTVVYLNVKGELQVLPISSTSTWFSAPCSP